MTGEKDRLPPKFSFEKLRFHWVEVMADGLLYGGVLIGADENEIYLKGLLRWIVLPMDKVTSVRLQGELPAWSRRKAIDPEFYWQDDE